MKKILKTTIIIIIHFLFLQVVNCQIKMSLPENISQKFKKYCESVPREEIFIHTDREEYIAGEDLWFNVYLIDRQSFRPSLTGRIAYFELVNTENVPVVQRRILIEKGFGPGQILLPDTLSSGTYTIRAYTSWMKNFQPYNCFLKEIRIYNALSNKDYREKIYTETKIISGKITSKIPVEPDSGLILKVNNFKTDTLEIILNTNESYRTANRNLIYLFIETHGIVNHVSTEKILTDVTRINISKKELIQGINHLTVFDSKGQPICERFFYSPVKGEKFLTLYSIDSCNKRSKISLEIEFANGISTALDSANLSISVAPVTDDREITGLNDYMIFGTEFERIPRDVIKRRKISELPPRLIDSILVNVRSNWINWEKILSGDLPHLTYQMEKEDHVLSGKLLTNEQQAARSDEFLLMCTPGKKAAFQYAKTDRNGNFSFNLSIDEDIKDLIIMPADVSNNHKIIIESSFSDFYIQSGVLVDSIKRPIPAYISDWGVNYQVRTIYGVSAHGGYLNQVLSPHVPIRFYGKPDIELLMEDYISLPVMDEVFFELLPRVYLKKKKSAYEISITDRIDDRPYKTSPFLLIDGVIIRDPSLIADLDPEIVEKIDVIKEKYLVGDYYFSGIVNVITRSGDFSCVPFPGYMIRLPYRVIDKVWSFVSPDYTPAEINKSRIPDFRNTLYWNPSVKPDKNGKARIEFWSSDVVSDYEINVQGITSAGKLMSAKKFIRVE